MFRIDKVGTKKRDDQDEIDDLEDIVFNKHKKLKSQNYTKFKQHNDEEPFFQIDTTGDLNNLQIEKETDSKKSIWQDDDDEVGFDEVFDKNKRRPKLFGSDSKYKDYLEKKFTNLNPVPKWATTIKSEQIDDDDLERTAGDILSKQQFNLQTGNLDYKHCVAINRYDNLAGTLNTTEFHRSQRVCLLSSRKKVKLFNIDEEQNEKLKELTFEQYGVSQSKFTMDGNQIVMANCYQPGKFYYYDIVKDEIIKVPIYRNNEALEFRRFALSNDNEWIAACGSKQRIHLMSNKTKEILADLKINSQTSTLTFSPDSSKLFSHSGEGKVYVFDLRKSNRCVHRFVDEGCITGASIDISSNQQYLCCGSESGIANIYDYNEALTHQTPKPLKTISNLVTSLNRCKFNHNTELLLLSSDQMDNAFKLVHLPSFKIFANIPGINAKYGCITDCDISPNSYYISIANKKGQAKLIRLLHYSKY